MKAIILSAGQGKRLGPLTRSTPKCLLPVKDDVPVLGHQLKALAACGVHDVTVMVGFGAEQVERYLADHPVPGLRARTCFNPFYATSDNLVTCWLARPLMDGDFLLLNGDTLFVPDVLRRLLSVPTAPLTLAINRKDGSYDDDDMKVALHAEGDGRRLRRVGKTLPVEIVDGESIGLMVFRGLGVPMFRRALNEAVRTEDGQRRWYLSVVDEMARRTRVETADISGAWWGEVDSPEDLADVRAALDRGEQKREVPVWEPRRRIAAR
jgi:choline kinase